MRGLEDLYSVIGDNEVLLITWNGFCGNTREKFWCGVLEAKVSQMEQKESIPRVKLNEDETVGILKKVQCMEEKKKES